MYAIFYSEVEYGRTAVVLDHMHGSQRCDCNIIGYFLKRTIDRQDKVENDVNELKENAVTEADFKELKNMVSELRDKFVSKEEMRELKDTIKKIKTSI